VAIPTDFKGPTPIAATTKSFPVFGSATVGIWALDIDGTLSATTSRVDLGPNCMILFDQAYTNAQLIPLVKDWLSRMGAFHEGAGGQGVETTKQIAVTAQTCT
jgi:hypothetical protein